MPWKSKLFTLLWASRHDDDCIYCWGSVCKKRHLKLMIPSTVKDSEWWYENKEEIPF